MNTGIELPPTPTPPRGGELFLVSFFAGVRPRKMTRRGFSPSRWEGVLPPRLRIKAVKGLPLPAGIAGGWVFRGSHFMPVSLRKNSKTVGRQKHTRKMAQAVEQPFRLFTLSKKQKTAVTIPPPRFREGGTHSAGKIGGDCSLNF